jgi:hypothetical protein
MTRKLKNVVFNPIVVANALALARELVRLLMS